MPPKATIAWDDAAKLKLLLHVIEFGETKLSQENWKAVANAFGGDVTASALSQKFYKLKKESERLSANSSAPNTPTKTPTPRGPRKRKATENNAETETPQSNKKRSTKENGISIKSEPAANSDSGEDTVD